MRHLLLLMMFFALTLQAQDKYDISFINVKKGYKAETMPLKSSDSKKAFSYGITDIKGSPCLQIDIMSIDSIFGKRAKKIIGKVGFLRVQLSDGSQTYIAERIKGDDKHVWLCFVPEKNDKMTVWRKLLALDIISITIVDKYNKTLMPESRVLLRTHSTISSMMNELEKHQAEKFDRIFKK